MDWKSINHFVQREFDDPDYPESGRFIDPTLLYKVDVMRGKAEEHDPKILCITHAKVGGAVDMYGNHGHAANSFHLKWNDCLAVDFHFITTIAPRDQYVLIIEPMGFAGAGIYYDQKWNGKLLDIAFHVDEGKSTWQRPQRWTRRNGVYTYLLGR